jgi:hypothetical protein
VCFSFLVSIYLVMLYNQGWPLAVIPDGGGMSRLTNQSSSFWQVDVHLSALLVDMCLYSMYNKGVEAFN